MALFPLLAFLLLAVFLGVLSRRTGTATAANGPDFLPLCTTLLSVTAIILPLMAEVHVGLLPLPGVASSRRLILGGIIVDGLAVAIGIWLAISLAARQLTQRSVFLLLNLQFSSLLVSLVAVAVGLWMTPDPGVAQTSPAGASPLLVAKNLPALGSGRRDVDRDWGVPSRAGADWMVYEGQQFVIFCFVQESLIRIVQERSGHAHTGNPCED